MVAQTSLDTANTPLPVAAGGTGIATATAYGVHCAGTTATGPVQVLASLGSSGQPLVSGGAGTLPSFSGTLGAITTTSVAFSPTGNGLVGSTSGSFANTGYVGESVINAIPSASAVSLTSGANANVGSISLTAGVWLLYGNVLLQPSISISYAQASPSITSATFGDLSNCTCLSATTMLNTSFSLPTLTFNTASPSQIYLVVNAIFASGTCTASGNIFAIRYQ